MWKIRKDEESEMTQIEGRNQVLVALKRNVVSTVFLASTAHGQIIDKIVLYATKNMVNLQYLTRSEINEMSKTSNSQGIIAYLKNWEYTSLDSLIDNAKKKKHPFIMILDHIQDPHNLGAIIRTADAAGVDGIIIPKDRSAGVNETVMKTSVGAALTVPLVKVTNLSRIIDILKEEGFWLVGTDADAEKMIYDIDLNMPLAMLIGSEGKGLADNLARKSDYLVKLPMMGVMSSLNASVAAGVMMYEVVRQRTV